MATALLVYAIFYAAVWHMLFGAGEALNHDMWHTFKPRELPRKMRKGQNVHMKHHGHPNKIEHILIPWWGHVLIIKGIVLLGLAVAGPVGTLPLLIVGGASWHTVVVTYFTLSLASMLGMASYMWLYGVIHRNTHNGWSRMHPLYATAHMVHHLPNNWHTHFAILPIYEWLMWARPAVIAGVKLWKRYEDAHPSSQTAEAPAVLQAVTDDE